MRRRGLLSLGGVWVAAGGEPTLASVPITVGGGWGGSLPGSALRVVSFMRDACLSGVRLLPDRQPAALRVDSHAEGPSHIWLHFDGGAFAWIVVDIGPRDWCRLGYQFGHELGHVLCNGWGPDAKPRLPCQWVEEALMEAFSISGLGLLADRWAGDPPFAGAFGFAAIATICSAGMWMSRLRRGRRRMLGGGFVGIGRRWRRMVGSAAMRRLWCRR